MLKIYKSLIVLTLAQSFGLTAAPVLVLLGGIVGTRLAPSADLATLPITFQILGLASAAIPASILMSKFGRKAGFLLGTVLGVSASLLCAYAVWQESFFTFVVGTFLVGNYIAFLQQFRFAVAESVPLVKVPRSLSILMLAGIVAAFLGPEVGRRFSAVEGLPLYVGSFFGLAVMLSISFFILLVFYSNTHVDHQEKDSQERPLAEILREPKLILAIVSAAMAYSIMSLIMTATPLSMHEIDHYSLDSTTRVLQSHILAMYAPSFFSGILIARLGVYKVVKLGLFLMILSLAVGWGNPEIFHYWLALILLGFGWNFLFLGGTTLLTECYRSSERFKVQAVNDFSVFGMQALGSLGAGVLLASVGWNGLLLAAIPGLVALLLAIFLTRRPVAN
ncbi:MAG: MFS transporter [Pseudohongiellaceae bacterium]